MRTLSAALLAAQKSASATPYLKVTLSDRVGGIPRLAFARLYTGSEPDGYHAATMPGDGSLIRARASGGRVYYQRVASPGSGSDFSSWTDLGAAADAGVALCADGSRVLLFYVDSGGTLVKTRESTDNGATLGAAVTAATAAGAVTWLAADVKAGGDALVLYSVGATVYSAKRTGGSWGSPAAWTNSVASVAGLACHHQGDWNAAVAGTDAAGGAFLWTCVFGDGFSQAPGTWSPLRELARASSGSSLAYRAPFLSLPDTYRLTFVEKYTGPVSYNRPYHTYSPATADFASNLWREPFPFDLTSDYGQAVAFSTTAVWLSTPAGVWRATSGAALLDVSADVQEATVDERPLSGTARVVLRNDDGRYNTLPAQLKLGGELRISPGYATSSGQQASDGPAYWIERIERTSGEGDRRLVLHARDAWSLLAAWRARRQYAWAAGEKNVFGILQFIFACAGLEFSSTGASAASSNLYPAFTVHPGDSGLGAVRSLLSLVPDVIFARGEFAFLTEPLATETTDYAYGTDHPLLEGRYADLSDGPNRVQVFGRGIFGERFDWADVQALYDRLEQVDDVNLTAQSQVEGRADYVLRKQAIAAVNGELRVRVNCGQELYDVVEVTDAGAGLSAAKRRVLGLSLRYEPSRGVYEQRIALGGV